MDGGKFSIQKKIKKQCSQFRTALLLSEKSIWFK